MTLLDALVAPVETPRLCKIGRVAAALDSPYKEALHTLLTSDTPDQRIVGVLKEAGIQVSYSIIYRHRRGQCSCESVVMV